MKLDLNAAWDTAVRLIAGNREVMLVLAGVFFFLPYVLFALLVPTLDFSAASSGAAMDSTAVEAAINGFVAQYWWAILLLVLVQSVGATAVMAVIGDPSRPTVQQAMKRGAVYLPTQIGVQLALSLVLFLVLTIAIVLGVVVGSKAIMLVLSLMCLPLIVWLMARLSLASPVIAIERNANPLAAMARSWRLTSGTAGRLIGFYALLLAAFFVVSQVLGLVLRLITALPDAEVARVIDALLSGLLNGCFAVVGYAVLASVHRQLARAERVAAPEGAA